MTNKKKHIIFDELKDVREILKCINDIMKILIYVIARTKSPASAYIVVLKVTCQFLCDYARAVEMPTEVVFRDFFKRLSKEKEEGTYYEETIHNNSN